MRNMLTRFLMIASFVGAISCAHEVFRLPSGRYARTTSCNGDEVNDCYRDMSRVCAGYVISDMARGDAETVNRCIGLFGIEKCGVARSGGDWHLTFECPGDNRH